MDDVLLRFFDLAFDRASALEANQAIQRVRESLDEGGRVRNYEVLVPEGGDEAWLTGTLLPRLVYHLESLAMRPPARGLFLSVFRGEELLFLHAGDVLRLGASLLGVDEEELYRRFGTGELRRPMRDDEATQQAPLALPGPEE